MLGSLFFWGFLFALRYHVKWKSVLWRNLSQVECVWRVIKCARQLCDKGKEYAGGVTVSSPAYNPTEKRKRERKKMMGDTLTVVFHLSQRKAATKLQHSTTRCWEHNWSPQ